MNRLLSILVTLFILFLVYLWINHLMGSSKREETQNESTTNVIPEGQSQEQGEEYIIPDDDMPAEEVQSTEGTQAQTENEQESNQPPATIQQEPKSNPVVVPADPSEKKTTTPPTVTTTDSSGGTHLVIAGNFLTRANAEERVKELKKLGYSKAEVVNFELSEYHTACAGRYTDLNEARRIAKKIKDMNGIDTYVRHGN
ncbi:MAG TPA: SPOR domain-containing protein [Saprospiraceae bacterium]|nr:SPOR domain-containing protein [Saprospiraceae bacterium]